QNFVIHEVQDRRTRTWLGAGGRWPGCCAHDSEFDNGAKTWRHIGKESSRDTETRGSQRGSEFHQLCTNRKRSTSFSREYFVVQSCQSQRRCHGPVADGSHVPPVFRPGRHGSSQGSP